MPNRVECMNCGEARLHEFIDLKDQPNGNSFLDASELDREVKFPLAMMVCDNCWQVQINEFPSQKVLFDDHAYITGRNAPVVAHFKELAPRIVNKVGLKENDLVIDVGANDGTFLRAFQSQGMRVLGVDPSDRTGQLARAQGVTVFRQFWCHETGKSLKQLGVKPDAITATAVFYHVPDLHDFVSGLEEVMGPNTVFVVQGVNCLDLIEKNEFDHFYHEHSCIHAVGPLQRLFNAHGLAIRDVEFSPIHGGSFILYVYRQENPIAESPTVAAAIKAEEEAGLFQLQTYQDFAARVDHNMTELRALLEKLKAEGKTVWGLGAPVKGSTVLNYADIGPDLVSHVTEVNEFKIGRVTPGTHIPVIDENAVTEHPDYYLVLCWNFLDFLLGKYDGYLKAGGRFITPVPSVQILGPGGVAEA